MPKMQQVKSKDPNQQKLRDHKREWSDATSELISKIIAFKRGLNGRGDAKIGLPPSSIKDPLPSEIGGLLNQLASEFQQVVSDAESIISEQNSYSRTRRKKNPKIAPSAKPVAPIAQEPEKDKIVDTLSRLGNSNYSLEALGSNKLTRFWQYLTSIFSKKDFEKQRIGLLSQSADLLSSLEEFENAILSIKISSIPAAIGKYKDFKYNFNAFEGTYKGVIEMVARKGKVKLPSEKEQQEAEKENKIDEVKPEEIKPSTTPAPENNPEPLPLPAAKPNPYIPNDINKIKQDISTIFNANLGKDDVLELGRMIDEYDQENDAHIKSMWEERIKDAYKELLTSIAGEVQKKYGPTQIRNLQDVINHIKKNKTALECVRSEFMKTAHNALTRFLKRDLVKTLRYNKTSAVRLEIAEIVDDTYNLINETMNSLENDLSIDELNSLFEKMRDNMEKIKGPLHVLNVYYMKEFFNNREKNRINKSKNAPPEMIEDPLYDAVLKRKLKRDISEDIS